MNAIIQPKDIGDDFTNLSDLSAKVFGEEYRYTPNTRVTPETYQANMLAKLGDCDQLTEEQRKTLDTILEHTGEKKSVIPVRSFEYLG